MHSLANAVAVISAAFVVLAHAARVTSACTDNDAAIAAIALGMNVVLNGCNDIKNVGVCNNQNAGGDLVRLHCCATCDLLNTPPETSLPPADDADPVHLVLLGGQSDCTGQAKPSDLDADNDTYPDLAGIQSGVWFGGVDDHTKEVFIAPLEAGQGRASNNNFGPEVSLGRRIHEATGARVMVVKYCWGGSNVKQHWRPDTPVNAWDYDADDRTAAWLKANSNQDYRNKNALFVNQVYTARRVTEALDAAGVAYEWKAFAWVQGAGDSSSTWEVFGTDTARFFDAVRKRTVHAWDLPIIDNGAPMTTSGLTGKQYAIQLARGCNVRNVEIQGAVPDPLVTGCISGPAQVCPMLYDPTLSNHFGYDTRMTANTTDPNAWELRTTNKTFSWFAQFPTNQHAAYEGMILKGRMMANEYIRTFTDADLTDAMKADDPTLLVNLPKCEEGTLPTQEAVCWTDERTGDLREAVCIPDATDDDDGDDGDDGDGDDGDGEGDNQCLAAIQAACSEAATSQLECLTCLQSNAQGLLAPGAACEGQEATRERGHAVCRMLVGSNSDSSSSGNNGRPKRASQPQEFSEQEQQQQQKQQRRFIRGRMV